MRIAIYAAASFDKQLQLADLVGDLSWNFDLHSGTLSFGDKHCWQAQVLGTESHVNNTWLWAWANERSNIPPQLLDAALTVKKYGEQHGIPELTEPELPLGDEVNGHMLAMIASGICEADAYYRGPYEGGAVFLLIKDEKFERHSGNPVLRILHVFPQAISAIDIHDHRVAFVSYLGYYGLKGEPEDNAVVVRQDGKVVIRAEFDELNRLTKLEGTLAGKG